MKGKILKSQEKAEIMKFKLVGAMRLRKSKYMPTREWSSHLMC